METGRRCGTRGQAEVAARHTGAQDLIPWAHLARCPQEAKRPLLSRPSPLQVPPFLEGPLQEPQLSVTSRPFLTCRSGDAGSWETGPHSPGWEWPVQGWLTAGRGPGAVQGQSRSSSRSGTAGGPVVGARRAPRGSQCSEEEAAYFPKRPWGSWWGVVGGPGTPQSL